MYIFYYIVYYILFMSFKLRVPSLSLVYNAKTWDMSRAVLCNTLTTMRRREVFSLPWDLELCGSVWKTEGSKQVW